MKHTTVFQLMSEMEGTEQKLKEMMLMSKQIRIEDDIHAWLLDHKNSQRRNVSDVIRELIEFREKYQSD